MSSQIIKRVISSFIMAPMVILTIWYGKPVYENFSIPVYTIFLALLGTGLCWEWERMILKNTTINTALMTMFVCLCAFIAPDNPTFALWVVLFGALFLFWKSKYNVSLAFGVFYICLPIIALSYLYFVEGMISRELVLWLFFVVWATDIGAYFVGSSLKGPKILPRVSPKKTWSGLFGGVGFAMLVAYVFSIYLQNKGYSSEGGTSFLTKMLVVSAGGLAVVSQMGDFFESYIKRKLGLKDSSNLIPGHGGLFDRVDGLLFASVALSLIVFFVNQGWFQ